MNSPQHKPLLRAGVVLGAGMGAFLDGILLHHILQWHNMISSKVPADTLVGAKINMFWDGVFHAGAWSFTALGLILLFRVAQSAPPRALSGRALLGAMILGWGVFNLADGIINHHILGLHHLREDVENPLIWDFGYLVFGATLVAAGAALTRRTASQNSRSGTSSGARLGR